MSDILGRIERERSVYQENFKFAARTLDEWGFTAQQKAAAFGFPADGEWKKVEHRIMLRVDAKVQRCGDMIIEMKCLLAQILNHEEQKAWLSQAQDYLEGKTARESVASGGLGTAKALAVLHVIAGDAKVSPEKEVAQRQIAQRAAVMADVKTPYGFWRI